MTPLRLLGMKTLPSHYSELLQDLWRLNRVHNGDETYKACEILRTFCTRYLKGESIIHEYQPGTNFNSWIIPKRWILKSYKLLGPSGELVASHLDHPLAVCPNSCSVETRLDLEELKKKIISRSDLPDTYTFYFRRMYRHWEHEWNISLPRNVVDSLPKGEYVVDIQTVLTDEPMPVFEYVSPGESDQEIILSAHLDHPGLVNDSLSGCIASLEIVDQLEKLRANRNYTYRVWLVPEIIGSAVQLKAQEQLVEKTLFAFCPNMTAHAAPLAMCTSKSQSSLLDHALRLALKNSKEEHVVGSFHKYPDCGDEISFDTVGYGIPTPTLSRIGEMFTYYHSSADDFDTFMRADWQNRHEQFVEVCAEAMRYLEDNRVLFALFRGNPCLSNPEIDLYLEPVNMNNLFSGARTLTDLDGNEQDLRNFMEFFLDALSQAGVSVLEIAQAANIPFNFVRDYALQFEKKGLLKTSKCDRRYVLPRIATTSLSLAGLVRGPDKAKA